MRRTSIVAAAALTFGAASVATAVQAGADSPCGDAGVKVMTPNGFICNPPVAGDDNLNLPVCQRTNPNGVDQGCNACRGAFGAWSPLTAWACGVKGGGAAPDGAQGYPCHLIGGLNSPVSTGWPNCKGDLHSDGTITP
jgi:hypothetical protein